jgi:branched-chain amino acid transport system substrate-binding protein
MLGKVDGTEGVCARFFCGHAHGREVCTAGGKAPDSPGGIVYRGAFVGTDQLIQEAGADAEEAVITQVVPPYYLTDLKTVALYRRSLSKYMPSSKPNFVSLEGFVDAMVIVEGLKKAGKELTREGLIRGIESVHNFDIGLGTELKLDYSAKDHKGFDHIIPTVIRGGRAVPFADWLVAAPH